jgi:hypothetical protein
LYVDATPATTACRTRRRAKRREIVAGVIVVVRRRNMVMKPVRKGVMIVNPAMTVGIGRESSRDWMRA